MEKQELTADDFMEAKLALEFYKDFLESFNSSNQLRDEFYVRTEIAKIDSIIPKFDNKIVEIRLRDLK